MCLVKLLGSSPFVDTLFTRWDAAVPRLPGAQSDDCAIASRPVRPARGADTPLDLHLPLGRACCLGYYKRLCARGEHVRR
jgi:hypothetical protein